MDIVRFIFSLFLVRAEAAICVKSDINLKQLHLQSILIERDQILFNISWDNWHLSKTGLANRK